MVMCVGVVVVEGVLGLWVWNYMFIRWVWDVPVLMVVDISGHIQKRSKYQKFTI